MNKDDQSNNSRFKDSNSLVAKNSENLYKRASEALLNNITTSFNHFKNKPDFATKNEDNINIVHNLFDENKTLKAEFNNYYYNYEKIKDKYDKLKHNTRNNQMNNDHYDRVCFTVNLSF